MKFALSCLLCAWILLGSGCASTATEYRAGTPLLLRMVDYRTGARMELVNPSHTSAVDQYSKPRSDSARKVTDEEWMVGLVQYMNDEGWAKEQQQGNAPALAKNVLSWSLERVGPSETSFVAARVDAKGAELKRLLAIKNAFVATYNATSGFQAVRSQPGKLPFKVPEYPSASQPKKGGN